MAAELCGGMVLKCLNASRAKTKEKAVEAFMLVIEAEKQDIAQVSISPCVHRLCTEICTGFSIQITTVHLNLIQYIVSVLHYVRLLLFCSLLVFHF